MSDNEICSKLQCYNNLKNGIYIFQFIEQDLKLQKKKNNAYLEIENNYIPHPFHEKDNPINFISLKKILKLFRQNNLKFKLINSKLSIESYAKNEDNLRVKRFLMFKKI